MVEHGSTARWRSGCRCVPCRHAHNTQSLEWRRAIADTEFSSERRARLLDLLREGELLVDAAIMCAIPLAMVYARRRRDREWARALDAALLDGRVRAVPGMTHGRESTYRRGCRCPECRQAHHPEARSTIG